MATSYAIAAALHACQWAGTEQGLVAGDGRPSKRVEALWAAFENIELADLIARGHDCCMHHSLFVCIVAQRGQEAIRGLEHRLGSVVFGISDHQDVLVARGGLPMGF
jgi:hypothetical protein